ncbi:hypothetical protein EW145_g1481 [Phellinidium pouzarii]|uniref:Uncharacterized protein n=1 Tax=Phellinidium pouzarii TaxID=167371 RepID=A0A4S4LEW8_9AGAM|nr:hypothetical protein EW145_g1481 [Phellinidium pouzarii]
MGLRVAFVICTTSFLLGILFVHWIADSLTLWKSFITREDIWTSAAYYSVHARAPAQLGYALAAVVTLGAATILWSFGDGAAGNLMFDGASISFDETFSSIPSTLPDIIPATLKSEVLNLASGNLVCSVALTGVIALQAARWWAEHADSKDEEENAVRDLQSARKLKKRGTPNLSASRLTTSTTEHDDARSRRM